MMRVRAALFCGVLVLAPILIGIRHHYLAVARNTKAEVETVLNHPVTQFICDGERFDAALARLGVDTGVQFDVRWDVLRAAGVEKDWPIDLRVYQRDVRRTLEDVLDCAGGGNVQLTFRIGGEGRVVITTVAQDVVTRVYDVSRFFEPGFNPQLQGEALVRFVAEEVDHLTWQDHGNNKAKLAVSGGRLACVTTSRNQDKIESLLKQMDFPGAIQTNARLNATVATLSASDVPLSRELESLSAQFHLRFDVKWDALRKLGITPNSPISMNIRRVRFSKALSVMLDALTGGAARSTVVWYVKPDGSIVITSREDSFAITSSNHVYDIRDLIFMPPTRAGENAGPTREDLMDAIERLIRDTVDSDGWGGKAEGRATLFRRGLRLYVRQTAENHRQIENLLEQIREEAFSNPRRLPARNRDMLTDDGRPGVGN
jgi:hypothetical protein